MNRSLEDVPNKPVLPTARPSPNHYAPGSLRRHIGQPLGSLEERRGGALIVALSRELELLFR